MPQIVIDIPDEEQFAKAAKAIREQESFHIKGGVSTQDGKTVSLKRIVFEFARRPPVIELPTTIGDEG